MIEASRQSGRFSVPTMTDPVPLRAVLPYIENFKNRWVFYEKERETSLRDVMSSSINGHICMVIGPEGGMEESEVGWLKEHGFTSCHLGENILRTETTPLVVLSVIFYELNMK